MGTTADQVDKMARAVSREIPAPAIADFLAKFENVATKNGGSCGSGCGMGCCGSTCKTAEPDGLVFDIHGHTELSASALHDLGTKLLPDLKNSIGKELSDIANKVTK